MVQGYAFPVPGEQTMRHIQPVSSQRPAQAATLLTKAQAISNIQGVVQIGQESLVLVQQVLDIFSKGE